MIAIYVFTDLLKNIYLRAISRLLIFFEPMIAMKNDMFVIAPPTM